MKRILIILIALLSSFPIAGQYISIPKNGGYTNLLELKTSSPKYEDTFQVVKRTTGDIKAWGGNDYKVESSNNQISKEVIKREIIGICKDDSLYLNGIPITGLIWYAKVEILGKYCFLRPAYPASPKIIKQLGLKNEPRIGNNFGAIGGAIEGAKLAMQRISIIYNIETGESMLLSKSNILKILDDYPALKSEYVTNIQEEENSLLEILRKINNLK
jgi:uncharacterized protein YxeA